MRRQATTHEPPAAQAQTHLVDGQIQIREDLPFQKKVWVVQRIGWAMMALLLLAAALGLFGQGPLSDTVAGKKEGVLWVEYHRFTRHGSPEDLRVHWGPNLADREGKVRLWVNKRYLQDQRIEHVLPQPESVETGEDRLIYVFKVADPARPGSAVFSLITVRSGPADIRLGIEGGPSAEIRQFIYP